MQKETGPQNHVCASISTPWKRNSLSDMTCPNMKRGPGCSILLPGPLSSFSFLILDKKEAAAYSPALHCSTIGACGLNFSVRNGKRCDPTAMTT